MKKFFLLSLLSVCSFAEDAFISNVSFSGSGCANEEAMAVMSPDHHTISLLFDNYSVEAGIDGARRDRKNCNIRLSVAVPENKRAVIKKIDYRGYSFIPERSKLRFVSKYHVEIPEISFKSRTFKDNILKRGEVDEDIFFEQHLNERLTKRACGRDFTLNLQTNLVVMGAKEQSFASIDSLDSGINYTVEYEECVQQHRRSNREREIRRRQARRFQDQNDIRRERRERRRVRRMRESREERIENRRVRRSRGARVAMRRR